MAKKPDWLAQAEALPTGTTRVRSGGLSYLVTKSVFAQGGSIKLVGRELGGNDYISANIYHLKDGARLFPCEMPVEKVTTFLRNIHVDAEKT